MHSFTLVHADVTGYQVCGFLVATGPDYYIIAQTIEITGNAKQTIAIPRSSIISHLAVAEGQPEEAEPEPALADRPPLP